MRPDALKPLLWILIAWIFYWVLSGCARDIEDIHEIHKWKTYTINKGSHSSGLHINTFSRRSLDFKAVFTESCIYNLTTNQDDINKLYGFSDCGDNHVANSARFGWRWYNNNIEIFAFVHNDGVFKSQYMGNAPINIESDYAIRILDGQYEFSFNGHTILMDRSCSKIRFNRYYLYPYFGGDEVAPHKMKIKIKES